MSISCSSVSYRDWRRSFSSCEWMSFILIFTPRRPIPQELICRSFSESFVLLLLCFDERKCRRTDGCRAERLLPLQPRELHSNCGSECDDRRGLADGQPSLPRAVPSRLGVIPETHHRVSPSISSCLVVPAPPHFPSCFIFCLCLQSLAILLFLPCVSSHRRTSLSAAVRPEEISRLVEQALQIPEQQEQQESGVFLALDSVFFHARLLQEEHSREWLEVLGDFLSGCFEYLGQEFHQWVKLPTLQSVSRHDTFLSSLSCEWEFVFMSCLFFSSRCSFWIIRSRILEARHIILRSPSLPPTTLLS